MTNSNNNTSRQSPTHQPLSYNVSHTILMGLISGMLASETNYLGYANEVVQFHSQAQFKRKYSAPKIALKYDTKNLKHGSV